MNSYLRWVTEFAATDNSGISVGSIPGYDLQAEPAEEQLLDYIMLRLRLADGIPMDELQHKFGLKAAQTVDATLMSDSAYARKYACEVWLQGQRHIRLTDPEGFLMSNDCIATLFAELSTDDCTSDASLQATIT